MSEGRPIHFGVFDHLDQDGSPPRETYETRLRIIEKYDAAGFYAYHVAEHHGSPIGLAPSPTVFLSAVAQRTRSLRFGPMIFALPLYHPLRLIEEICMLDQMSGGRLDIGFGRGASPIEIAFFDEDPKKAEEIYTEALQLVLQGLTSEVLTFSGRHFTVNDVPMIHRPFQKPYPPLWYGVHSVPSAERAARAGFQVISLDDPATTRALFEQYRKTWRETHAGGAAEPKMGLGRFIVVADSDDQALRIARRGYTRWHENFTFLARRHNHRQTHPRPLDYDGVIAVGQGVAGSPRTVASALRKQLEETGSNYVVGQFAFGDLTEREVARSLDLFVSDVMPELKGMTVASSAA